MKKTKIEEILKNFLRKIWIGDRKYLKKIEKNYLLLRNYKNKNESDMRKEISIFDFKNLSEEMGIYTNEYYFGNSLYGIIENLRIFSGFEKEFVGAIEHGLYLGHDCNKEEINKSLKKILTFGESRKRYLEKFSSNKIYKIGPYINYAQSLYDEKKIKQIKKEIGKTLVFFPYHSIESIEASYEKDKILKKLNELKSEFKTIIICLYYEDINKKKADFYIKNGFKVVTAGHKYDKNFLNRLKSIIYLADETASNAVGTHIGYCIYLKKPHFLIESQNNMIFKEEKIKKWFEGIKDSYLMEENEIMEVFKERTSTITNAQEEICNFYWGFKEIKSKEEIFKILSGEKDEEVEY